MRAPTRAEVRHRGTSSHSKSGMLPYCPQSHPFQHGIIPQLVLSVQDNDVAQENGLAKNWPGWFLSASAP